MADIQRTLHVYIGNAGEVGILRFEAQGSRQFSTFAYSDAWLKNPRRFALSPSMPLETARYFNRADDDKASPLPMPFADTTPDSWGRSIIRKDARENGIRGAPLTEIDLLAAVDDFSRMGALRFKDKPEDASYRATTPTGRHEMPPLLELNDLGRSIAELERREPMTAADLGKAMPNSSVRPTFAKVT